MDGRLKIPNPIKSKFQSSDSLKGLELSCDKIVQSKISMGFHGVSGRVNLVIFLHIGMVGTVPQDYYSIYLGSGITNQKLYLLESREGAIRLRKCVYQ